MACTTGRAQVIGNRHVMLFIVVMLSLAVTTCSARDCFCNRLVCDNDVSNCSSGVTMDSCGCCEVCARGLGEACGGEGEDSGVCGKGLTCEIHSIPGNVISTLEKGTCKGRSRCLL